MKQHTDVFFTDLTVPKTEVMAAYSHMGEGEVVEAFSLNGPYEILYAPAFHEDGHEGHNKAARIASEAWPAEKIVWYETYAPRGQRTRTDNEVPYEPWMVARKFRALSCFVSQIEQESTRPWFTYLLDVREWVA